MVIYEYKCAKCGKEQARWFGDTEDRIPKKPCEECGAAAEHLNRILSPQKSTHVSWGTWRL